MDYQRLWRKIARQVVNVQKTTRRYETAIINLADRSNFYFSDRVVAKGKKKDVKYHEYKAKRSPQVQVQKTQSR